MTNTLLPEGESLRRAVRWISEARQDTPTAQLLDLVREANLRFDLSPAESEYLLTFFNRPLESN